MPTPSSGTRQFIDSLEVMTALKSLNLKLAMTSVSLRTQSTMLIFWLTLTLTLYVDARGVA